MTASRQKQIPNFENVPIIGSGGMWSESWSLIMQQLFSVLQTNFGSEGIVAPTLTAAQITAVQNNQLENGQYSCQYGTIVYNSTANSMMMAISDGGSPPKPVFKTVTLT